MADAPVRTLEPYRVVNGHRYRLMTFEECKMLNELVQMKFQGGPYTIVTHVIQQHDGYWIEDNGCH